ncbi:MAG: hypothetical protein H7641_05695, partial [Candidatus Heimdallarchaeota archaeon]|nr:hypothetical protein [Candidatus Heimdallarchaeota archaeon]MCK4877054.1 hypothetical protein [Candidatus Heimdallarchaeota archaeon]
MRRDNFAIFSEGKIGKLKLPNRLVRSSTWDPSILSIRQMTDEVLNLYRNLALGGIGLIITGGFPVFRERTSRDQPGDWLLSFSDLCVKDLERMIQAVRDVNPQCKIIAQLENGNINAKPSDVSSPFSKRKLRILNQKEIFDIIDSFVEAIIEMKIIGFDGVQLHAAHGGLLSRFLSSYSNQRDDIYGGSASKRVRIIKEIVSKARETVGDFPILIKMNCTDFVEGGTD